ncbi:MAG: DUF4175 family protein, partial [Flavobacteriales bacterium]
VMQNGFDLLIQKLNQFLRRFYLNTLIRGLIYTLALWLAVFLLASSSEYVIGMSSLARQVVFYAVVLVSMLIFWKFIIQPAYQLFRLKNRKDYNFAAQFLGEHFEDIQDKIRNVLDLKAQANTEDQELLMASIDQKMAQIKTFDFKRAVSFKDNVKYLPYFLVPALIVLGFWLSGNSQWMSQGSERIVRYSEEFLPEAPFDFVILNDNLKAHSAKPYRLKVELKGDYHSDNLDILLSDTWISMQHLGQNQFEYTFTNLKSDLEFRLKTAQFSSKTYQLEVLPFPEIKSFQILATYPKYTQKPAEKFDNQGDLIVPEGSKLRWQIETKHGDVLAFDIADSTYVLEPKSTQFSFDKTILNKEKYSLQVSNAKVKTGDVLEFELEVLKDQYPKLKLEKPEEQEGRLRQIFLKGTMSDDYGFSYLHCVVQVGDSLLRLPVSYNPNHKQQVFHYLLDVEALALNAGDEWEYYFELADNDGVNGSKKVKSSVFEHKLPSAEELEEDMEASNQNLQNKLEDAFKESKAIKDELKKLQADLLQKEELTWEDKEQIKALLEKQKQVEQSIEKLQKQHQQMMEETSEFVEDDEQLEKQKQIEELLEELLDEETRALFEEMEKLMENLDKKELQKKLEDIKQNNFNLEKELDRSLELLKQFQLEKKMQDNIDDLFELAEKQKDLAEKTKESSKKDEETQKQLAEDQEKLNEEFEDMKDRLEDMKDLNESLEKPFELEDTKAKEEEIGKEMEKAKSELDSKQKKEAQKSQEKSGEELESLAMQMQSQKEKLEEEAAKEDMEALQQILENLIDLSFEEEQLVLELPTLEENDPNYLRLMKAQNDIKNKSQLIADSLFALSKRQVQVEQTVIKELGNLDRGLSRSIVAMAERQVPNATKNGQDAMTAANNLALFLSQVLDQMQKQAGGSSMKGEGSCSKPGGDGSPSGSGEEPSMQQMKSLQEQMKDQLKSLQQDLLNEGKQDGGEQEGGEQAGEKGKAGKNGKNGEQGEGGKGGTQGQPGQGGEPSSNTAGQAGKAGNAKQIMQTVAKQEAIRRQLEQISESMEQGTGKSGLQKAIEKMKEIEKDIVNQSVTSETLHRQKEIMQQLIRAEKAEREQEQDKKRQAKAAKQHQREDSEIWKKYIEEKQKQSELLYQKPIKLSPYYQNAVERYFQSINN